MSNPIKIKDRMYNFSLCTREQLQAFTEVYFELAGKQVGFGYNEWCTVADAAEIKQEKKSDVATELAAFVQNNLCAEQLFGDYAMMDADTANRLRAFVPRLRGAK